jgi:hypothetical protein
MNYDEDFRNRKVSRAAVAANVDSAKEKLVNELLGLTRDAPKQLTRQTKAKKFGVSKKSGKSLYRVK